MAVLEPFTVIRETDRCIAHVTIVNFDPDKHPDIYNRELAKIILDREETKS